MHVRVSISTRFDFRLVGMYAMRIPWADGAIYSVPEPISEATNLNLGDLNAGTGYMVGSAPLLMINANEMGRSSCFSDGDVPSGSPWLRSMANGLCICFQFLLSWYDEGLWSLVGYSNVLRAL